MGKSLGTCINTTNTPEYIAEEISDYVDEKLTAAIARGEKATALSMVEAYKENILTEMKVFRKKHGLEIIKDTPKEKPPKKPFGSSNKIVTIEEESSVSKPKAKHLKGLII